MEKIKKKKSEKILKICLQVLALQFPNIKIKYGYGSVLKNMHVVELISESNPESNEILMNVCAAIYEAFHARFVTKEEMVFIFPNDDKTLRVEELIAEWNNDISESDKLTNALRMKSFTTFQAINKLNLLPAL